MFWQQWEFYIVVFWVVLCSLQVVYHCFGGIYWTVRSSETLVRKQKTTQYNLENCNIKRKLVWWLMDFTFWSCRIRIYCIHTWSCVRPPAMCVRSWENQCRTKVCLYYSVVVVNDSYIWIMAQCIVMV